MKLSIKTKAVIMPFSFLLGFLLLGINLNGQCNCTGNKLTTDQSSLWQKTGTLNIQNADLNCESLNFRINKTIRSDEYASAQVELDGIYSYNTLGLSFDLEDGSFDPNDKITFSFYDERHEEIQSRTLTLEELLQRNMGNGKVNFKFASPRGSQYFLLKFDATNSTVLSNLCLKEQNKTQDSY